MDASWPPTTRAITLWNPWSRAVSTSAAQLGVNAIFVMIIPYCMIHYGKPLPETIGAMGAGILLGTIAIGTRSIWGGVIVHVPVAVTMDVLALRDGCPEFGSDKPCR